jgi:hypothetical protein
LYEQIEVVITALRNMLYHLRFTVWNTVMVHSYGSHIQAAAQWEVPGYPGGVDAQIGLTTQPHV